MSHTSQIIASRRLFLRNGGAAAISVAAAALLADHEALAQSATLSQINLHDSAPTQFQEVGDIRLGVWSQDEVTWIDFERSRIS